MREETVERTWVLKTLLFCGWGAGVHRSKVNFVALVLSLHLYLGIKARLVDLDCQVPMACTYQVILPMCFWFYETKMNSLLEETGGYFLLHRDR